MIELSVLRTLEVEMDLEQKARIKAEKMCAELQEMFIQITSNNVNDDGDLVRATQVSEVTNQLNNAQARLVDYQMANEALRARAIVADQSYAEVRKQNFVLLAHVQGLEAHLEERDTTIKEIKSGLIEQADDKMGVARRVVKDNHKVFELVELNAQLEKKLVASEKKNQEFALSMKSFANDMNAASAKMSELEKENIALDGRKKALEARVGDLKLTLVRVTTERDSLAEARVDDLKKTLAQMTTDRDSVAEALDDSEKTCERMRPAVYKCAELEKKCANLEKVVIEAQDLLGQLIMETKVKKSVAVPEYISALVDLGQRIELLKKHSSVSFTFRPETNGMVSAPSVTTAGVGRCGGDDEQERAAATARAMGLLRIQVQQFREKNQSLTDALANSQAELIKYCSQDSQRDDSDTESESDSDDDLYDNGNNDDDDDNHKSTDLKQTRRRLALARAKVETLKEKLNVALEEKRSMGNQVQTEELAFRVSQKAQYDAITVLHEQLKKTGDALKFEKSRCEEQAETIKGLQAQCGKAQDALSFEKACCEGHTKAAEKAVSECKELEVRLARKDTLGAIELYQKMLEHLEAKGLKQQAMFIRAIFTPQDERTKALWNEMSEVPVNVWVVDFTYQMEQGNRTTFTRVFGSKADAEAACAKFAKHRSGVHQNNQMTAALVGRQSDFSEE
jgi:chromosome segregation ATPase